MNKKIIIISILFSNLFLAACATIAPYSEKSYENATAMKAEALNLLKKSTEEYSDHKKDVDALKLDMSKAIEYAKGIPKNDIINSLYLDITSDNKGSLYGVLKLWQQKGKIDVYYVKQISVKISKEFDEIISLEQAKNKL